MGAISVRLPLSAPELTIAVAPDRAKNNRSARQTDYHNVRPGVKMLTRVVVLIAALLVGCNRGTKKAAEPASTAPKQYTVADFYKNVSFDGDSWSPDKRKLLVSSNLSGIWNAYAVSLDRGDPQPLTKSTKDSVFALSYFPHDEKIIYSGDQGGNELTHITFATWMARSSTSPRARGSKRTFIGGLGMTNLSSSPPMREMRSTSIFMKFLRTV